MYCTIWIDLTMNIIGIARRSLPHCELIQAMLESGLAGGEFYQLRDIALRNFYVVWHTNGVAG